MQTLMGQNLFLFVDIFKRRIYLNLLANNDTNKVFIIGIHNIKFLTSVETKLKMFKGTVSLSYVDPPCKDAMNLSDLQRYSLFKPLSDQICIRYHVFVYLNCLFSCCGFSSCF